MAIYLGLDASTQSITALAIKIPDREIMGTWSVNFDESLPHWKTENGVLPAEDPRVAHSPPLMWVEALELLLSEMAADGFSFERVVAIAGSGQQHGSVYLNQTAETAFEKLPEAESLRSALEGVFSRATSPIWMDSSTTEECVEITESLGGVRNISELTGSAAFERFTGPQIRKFFKTEKENYERTWRIHLVSSFMASLLAGKSAPIDPGDGSGMNLMDLKKSVWAPGALDATAPGLEEKLPEIVPSDKVFSFISPYFVKKYGFRRDTKILPWSGDNPNSLVGVGLVEPGKVAISLGTSDTYFGFMTEARVDPAAEGHLFGSPTGHYMSLICFKNGSLARERIADRFGMDWKEFSDQIQATPPGNDGKILLPYFEPEITPRVLKPGVVRHGGLKEDDPANARAVIEAQAMSMASHSKWMGVKTKTIYATGGASENKAILQVLADVHDADVYRFEVSDSAALGAALRAFHGNEKDEGKELSWPEVITGFTEPDPETRIQPRKEFGDLYDEFIKLYEGLEKRTIEERAE